MANPHSPIFRAAFDAHKCARCHSHYVTIPGSLCGTCSTILMDQARKDTIRYYQGVSRRHRGNTTLDQYSREKP